MTVVVNLRKQLGTLGFTLRGDADFDMFGREVHYAGDVNGDGFADVIVGAPAGDDKAYNAGEAYVIFGRTGGYTGILDMTNLTPADGIVIQGAHREDFTGYSVSGGGDINGDGYADLIVDAQRADDGGKDSGNTYVVFGGPGAPGRIELDLLTPAQGFVIQGDLADQDLGRKRSLATGDVNGDGFDDVIIGTYLADDGAADAGKAYVVFGKAGGFGRIDLANLAPADGFAIVGSERGGWVGWDVDASGDVNGDGFDDMLISAPNASAGRLYGGEAFVVYGKAAGFGTINLGALTPADGFAIKAAQERDQLGYSVALVGDVNADGYDDIAVGTPNNFDKGDGFVSEVYVIYGGPEDRGPLDLLTFSPPDGFRIVGGKLGVGASVSSAGDVNGDGFGDLIVGAPGDSKGGKFAGAAFVVFGKAEGFGDIDVTKLGDADGFKIQGDRLYDRAGTSVSSAGDLNGDGFDDVIVGAAGNDGGGNEVGAAYVIYGMAPTESVTRVGTEIANTIHGGAFDDTLDGQGGDDTLIANAGNDSVLGRGGNDDLQGGDGDDKLVGGVGDDILHGGDGVDKLIGGRGADVLFGGPGRDTLTGGAGADSFHFSLGGTAPDGSNADRIIDFNQTEHDVIDLSDYDADPSTRPTDPFTFIGAAAFSGVAGELRSVFAGADTLVSGDTNGDQVADFTIRLAGDITLTAADFLFAAAMPAGGGQAFLTHLDVYQDSHLRLV